MVVVAWRLGLGSSPSEDCVFFMFWFLVGEGFLMGEGLIGVRNSSVFTWVSLVVAIGLSASAEGGYKWAEQGAGQGLIGGGSDAVLALCFVTNSTMKKSHSFKLLFLVFFLVLNIKQSQQQLPNHEGDVIPKHYHQINLTHVTGPESIAFDCRGDGTYVGVSDGRILKWQRQSLGWKEFAIPSPIRERKLWDGSANPSLEPICGRPLGLKFNKETCDLYIADAYFGLLVVGPNGGVAQTLATSAEGIPFRFTNGLDIDANTGVAYFTDSSLIFQRRKVYVLHKGLMFPNGIALSKNGSFLLLAESIKRRILKFKLDADANSYVPEVFAQLPRVPDNIKRNENGEFWVALNAGRLWSIQNDAPDPIGIKYDQEGNVMKQLDGYGGVTLDSISEVNEFNGTLYIGSVTKPYVGILNA
ncbi:protein STRICTOSIDINE SYNTHASE-LIKE 10-like [Durio zibethinus]|uniref:Protein STRICTOSIDINE SYNTHASE-LIKE 10-like n=1 Tax=Durio zibethinus TaxID=66656 RepID=A0A6P5WP19_DURZI|nr:protein STRICTOSIDINE SYNTHASE-LIKE 10-like [Durio zibethinus]